jgi:subtilisin family serine protease
MAVGAIDYWYWTTGPIANYSSQGLTNDGRIKPDISGPASVSTYTYGINAFSGTSAAAPHVAGAAALILSGNPSYSVSQLWSALTDSAIDIGDIGQDYIYGFGILNMPPVGAESISTPNMPGGSSTGLTGISYAYSAGGSFSNVGHARCNIFLIGAMAQILAGFRLE